MDLQAKIESLRRGVQYGLEHGKKNLIVGLDVLAALLNITTPPHCEHDVKDGDWCEVCSDARRAAEIENAEPDRPRCRVCGWPLASTAAQGCVDGNCCERPRRPCPKPKPAPESPGNAAADASCGARNPGAMSVPRASVPSATSRSAKAAATARRVRTC